MREALIREIMECRIAHGFKTPSSLATENEREAMLGKLMLVTTEVAEAAEAVRKNNLENFVEELADICIRVFDIAETMHIDIIFAIEAKHKFNLTRPSKHGKELSL